MNAHSRLDRSLATLPARSRLAIVLLLGLLIGTSAVLAAEEQEGILLWPDGAPGALGSEAKDIPTLTCFSVKADSATGAALVICPGGGYGHLAGHEGADYARFFNAHGITAFVLKYRLGSDNYRHPSMLQDAARAVRLVRARSEEWSLDKNRIGIVGSSAGGHLASTLVTHFDFGDAEAKDPIDRVSSRPDLGILCYAVISMGPLTHQGSKNNLLGPDPSPELIQLLSNETQVTSNTPPCFIWHTVEDRTVKVENSMVFAAALRNAGVPFELHLYEGARHGIGLGNRTDPSAPPHPWSSDCIYWLKLRGFAN